MNAHKNNNSEEVVDGLIDLVVIAIGTLELAGVDVRKAWKEVMRANMSKQRGIKPGRENSGGFDVFKPEGWTGPNHLGNHGYIANIYYHEKEAEMIKEKVQEMEKTGV